MFDLLVCRWTVVVVVLAVTVCMGRCISRLIDIQSMLYIFTSYTL